MNTPFPKDDGVVYIRTSERLLFRRCRRLWGWTGALRQNRGMKESADYFWLGTGVHFALEDYHGYNIYGHPAKAFLAYYEACKIVGTAPSTAADLLPLGMGMMVYYADHWLRSRDPLATLIENNEPQCEVNGTVDLGYHDALGRKVLYRFTIDRMIEDEFGRLWIGEYKTAKQFSRYHLDTDDQITSYCWTASKRYPGREIAGVQYMQFKKDLPQMPRILATGKVSTDARQATTHSLYRQRLLDMYGDVQKAPAENIRFLNSLVHGEDDEGDKFIIRQQIERNAHQIAAQEVKVRMELEEMLNPDLPLYPNPTRDCSWQCPLQAACIAMDDGGDWERILEVYVGPENSRETTEDLRWRNYLPKPQELPLPAEQLELSRILLSAPQTSQQSEETPEEQFLREFRDLSL